MWWLIPLVLLSLFVLTELVYRDEHRERSAAQRTWRQMARAMPTRDRREVGRAVRNGRAVADPQLAPAAVALASAIVASRDTRHLLHWLTIVLGLAWFAVLPVFAAVEQRWGLAVIAGAFPAGGVVLLFFSRRWSQRAEDALVANRRVADRPPSSAW